MCFPLYLEKVENGANLFETNTIFNGGDAAEFWLPIFFITYYSQWDLTLGVFLEIFALQKWYFFKILTLTFIVKVICYKN